jgi:hypothetical protein
MSLKKENRACLKRLKIEHFLKKQNKNKLKMSLQKETTQNLIKEAFRNKTAQPKYNKVALI